MKKSTMIVLVGFCLFIITFKTSAQADKEKNYESTSNSYKNISRIGLDEFMDMDFRLIGYFPKKEQWNQISEQIKKIPVDSLRYVDSLDVSQLGDSLYVKVYTQNYLYQSKNVYTIAKDVKNLTDTLKIY
jgi:coenzyme F420-reducing hydrogenase gamma subunit